MKKFRSRDARSIGDDKDTAVLKHRVARPARNKTLEAFLVAISPQFPDNSRSTEEKNNLAFPILSMLLAGGSVSTVRSSEHCPLARAVSDEVLSRENMKAVAEILKHSAQ
jgi:hypothetical protein